MKSLYIFFITIVLLHNVQAQDKILISGVVLENESMKPVRGVTLRLEDSNLQAQTDGQGKYELSLKGVTGLLYFTAIGYDTLFKNVEDLLAQNQIIYMQKSQMNIQEVVVSSGYEQFDIKGATGAYEVLGEEIINRNTGMDILSRIENMSSGMYYDKTGSSASFSLVGRPAKHNLFLQGVSTLRNIATSGSAAPLIIVDNFPYEGDINSLNPNDVESITILKDASAAAIWGARAGNGVIVITTKRAAKGGKFKIKLHSNMQMHDKPDLYANPTISSSELIDLEMDLYEKGFYNGSYNARTKVAIPPVVELLYRQSNGEITDEELQAAINKYRNQDVRTTMSKYMYRKSILNQHNIRVYGGNEIYKMGISVGYDKSLSTRVSDQNQRLTWKIDNFIRFSNKLDLDVGLRGTLGNQERSFGVEYYTDNGYKFPYVSVADDLGNPLSIPWDYQMAYIESAGDGKLLDWHFRPLDEVRNRVYNDKNNELVFDVRAKYKILPTLQLSIDYRYSKIGDQTNAHHNLDHYYVRNLINRGTEIIDNNIVYHFPYGGIRKVDDYLKNSHYGRTQLNLNKTFSNDHQLRAIAGMDIMESVSESYGFTMFGYNSERGIFDNTVDHTKQYPIFDNLASFAMVDYPVSEYGHFVNRTLSLYFNGSYTYLDRHILSSSLRRDASNLFGVETNNKWTPLWSVGYAYRINNEGFYNIDWLPELKLRTTYGVSGNVDNSLSSDVTMNAITNGSVWNAPYIAAAISTLPNPNLRWEKVKQTNIALDFSIGRGNRLKGSVDYYYKRTDDLLYTVPIDPTLGKSTAVRNIANTKTKGVNINLSSINIKNPIEWSSYLNFAYNNNWVIDTHRKYAGTSRYLNGSTAEDPGRILYGIYSYKWAGLDHETGLPMGIVDGEKSMDYRTLINTSTPLEDLVFHGSSRPLYFGSLRNNVRYRDFAFSFNITYQFDYYFRRKGLDYVNLLNNGRGHKDFQQRWQNPGDEEWTDVPAFVYPLNSSANTFYQNSEPLIERGDFIYLNDIRVDYNLDLRLGSRRIVTNIFSMVNNVGMLWKATKLDIDPQYRSNIPMPRYFSFGFKLTY